MSAEGREPTLRDLQAAREEFRALLQVSTPEAQWQALFSRNPFLLSRALPLKLFACDILPLGRPGLSEPDFVIYPGSPRSQAIHGLIELKTNKSRIISNPRRKIIKLSESANTAIAQLQSYDADYNRFSPVPRVTSIIARSHLFVIIGMANELERLNDEQPLLLGGNLGDQVRFLTYDQLVSNFEQTVPSSTSILIPEWPHQDARLAALMNSSAAKGAAVSDILIFERLIRDDLFTKRFLCEFRLAPQISHSRYDLGSASRRFYERAKFGKLLEEYGLGALDTNLDETETDVYLGLALTLRGQLLRRLILEVVSEDDAAEITREGWYHACGRSSSEYVDYIKRYGWGSI